MVEERHPRLQGDRHRGAVDLGEDVVRQIGNAVGILHPRQLVGEARPRLFAERRRSRRRGALHQRPCLGPRRDQRAVVAGRILAEHPPELLQLLAGEPRPHAGRHHIEQTVPRGGRHRADQARQAPRHWPRQASQRPRRPQALAVAVIAGEQFVAPVARQRHRHVPPRHLRDEEGRDLRYIGERLVVNLRQPRHHRLRLRRRDIELGMLSAKMGRHRLRLRCLVIGRLVKADGEALHRRGALRLHQRRHQRRIDAPRQEHAERHVGHHPPRDGVAEQRLEPCRGFGLIHTKRRRLPPRRHIEQRPIAFGPRLAVVSNLEQHAGLQLCDAAIDAQRCRHIAGAEIRRERLRLDRARELRQRDERLQFRGEHDASVGASPIERLDAEPVAAEREHPLAPVEHREGEHADQPLHCVAHAPRGEPLDHHLGVGVAAEAVAGKLQLRAELARVVHLAVIGEREPSVGRQHRLRAGRAQVDDGKPRVTEREPRAFLHPHTLRVRPAVAQRRRHACRERLQRVVA